MTCRPLEDCPGLAQGMAGHAAMVQALAYRPSSRPGTRAALSRAARAGATIAATRRARRRHHAPPYPVPVATWRGREW